ALARPPRLGIVGFKLTAPIRHLSSIVDHPTSIGTQEEEIPLSEALRRIEEKGAANELQTLRRELDLDAVLYGEIPWYGTIGTIRLRLLKVSARVVRSARRLFPAGRCSNERSYSPSHWKRAASSTI